MAPRKVRYLTIARHAEHAVDLTTSLARVHQLGYTAGNATELWSNDFQRRAAPIYLRSLPVHYLRRIERAARSCGQDMSDDIPSGAPESEWAFMARYLLAVSDAIGDLPGVGGRSAPVGDTEVLEWAPTGLLRLDEMAALAHPEGVSRLHCVASAVARFSRRHGLGGVSEEEISWLRSLANGERTIEVAARHGHSERGFYRSLAELWHRLGVDSRSEALALAAQVGWLDERQGVGV